MGIAALNPSYELFEAVASLPADEQRVVQAVLDGLIVKHRTRQLAELHTTPVGGG